MTKKVRASRIALSENFGWENRIISFIILLAGFVRAGHEAFDAFLASIGNRFVVQPFKLLVESCKPAVSAIGNILYAITALFASLWNLTVPHIVRAAQNIFRPLTSWVGKLIEKRLAASQRDANEPTARKMQGRRHRHAKEKGIPGKNRHPKGLYILFLTEMWERFSFYLMIGILLPFLTDHEKGGMGLDGVDAAKIVGLYAAMVYFTPFIGGLLADRMLGLRRTIALGGFLMMVGHGLCALESKAMFYSGLVFLVLGNGGFKPNISTLLGNMYPGKDDESKALHDRAYSIFYVGINLGALICNIAAALVRNYFDRHPEYGIVGWHGAFGTAAIGMLIGLINFVLNYHYLGQFEKNTETTTSASDNPELEPEPKESLRPLWTQCLGPAAVCGAIGYFMSKTFNLALKPHNLAFLFACVPVILFYVNVWRKLKSPLERGRTAVLMVVISFSLVFWSVFHQNHTALNEHAVSKTDRDIPASLEPLTRAITDFAEEVPLGYYLNAGPETPRPATDRYVVVNDEAYKAFKKQDKLMIREPGQSNKLRVTAEQFGQIYRFKNARQAENHQAINAEIYQSINPVFVLIFTPIILALFAVLKRRKLEPSTPAKIAIGIIIVGGGPLTMLACTLMTNDAAIKASSWWLIGSYAIATVGELFLSPMGTGLVHKLAPRRIQAFMMGGWFMSSAIGNKLSGVFGEMYYTWNHTTFYAVLTGFCFVAGSLLLCLVPWMKRQMRETEEETVSVSLNLTGTIIEMERGKTGQKSSKETSDPAVPPSVVLDPEFEVAVARESAATPKHSLS